MKKYLEKLVFTKYPEHIVYNIETYSCGDGYKNGTKHRFTSNDQTDVTLLIDIIRKFRLGTKITNITKNSFEFESDSERKQIFCFRLCRFVRTAQIKKILKNIILINKSGVRIQNAFILGHYYSHIDSLDMNIQYYYGPRDMLYTSLIFNDKRITALNKPYKTLKECINIINNNSVLYSHIFRFSEICLKKEKTELFEILKTKNFKKAEKYLLNVWKLK